MAWLQHFLAASARFTGFPSQLQDGILEPAYRQNDLTCPGSALSCHNSSAVDNLCCFNAPGGTLLLTQFWDAQPPTGPSDSWTLHGLWPDNCDGSYEAYCDDNRNYRNISGILASSSSSTLEYMQKYWKDYKGNDENFWQHEWGKHGTCVSTLSPSCFSEYKHAQEVPAFFDRAVALFKTLPTYEWLKEAGVEPSHDKTFTFDEIETALSSKFDDREVRLGCRYGQLNEVWYFYNVRGALQNGDFVPTDRVGSTSTCPRTGIRYLPKRGTSTTSSTTGGPQPTSSPAPPGKSFRGRGQLNVIHNDGTTGCIISKGGWYTSGTCATFTTQWDGESFALKSSKGPCGIARGSLFCGSTVAPAKFEADGRLMSFNSSTAFSADNVARGRRLEKVYAGDGHEINIQIAWSS